MKEETPIIEIMGLKSFFYTRKGVVQAVDGVDLTIDRGETFGLVGESGCGKSTVALSILRLIPKPGNIVGGKILFNGEDLVSKSQKEIRAIRGGKIAMIFQDPTSSLNPTFTIGSQIEEAIKLNRNLPKEEIQPQIVQELSRVRIPTPQRMIKQYPHEYSGGMRQRAMIAMALSCEPELLIADEPTTNLDVTIQAQILELLHEIKEKTDATILIITHDLGVVAEMCDKVAVMYAGRVVEVADVITIFKKSKHPYTKALLQAIPRTDIEQETLISIPGVVPNLIDMKPSCRFHDRCSHTMDICRTEDPPMINFGDSHQVSCFLYTDNWG